jgi:hypothetical protein
MGCIRPLLARIAGGWLVVHLCLLVAVPTAICSTAPAQAAAAKCTCDHAGMQQVCPMHHPKPKSNAASGSHSCACRSASDPVSAIAASLIGPSAVLAPAASTIAPTAASQSLVSLDPIPLDSSFVPDSPPPRG